MRLALICALLAGSNAFLSIKGVCQADERTRASEAELFQPNVESLSHYRCPEWFSDAKFGIYVHWGVYSVAERGEWYAREMHEEGSPVYKHHLATWGHPSEFGYHDFIPLWKAEKFDADAWLALFAEAGAKYFTPCAIHHDGFVLGRTELTPFNAVEMGPHKDLLGMLREATLRHGLRFGVTTHCARSISWMQTCHGADKEGSYAGVPHIDHDPKYQDLYLLPFYDSNRADTEEAPVFWKEYWLARMIELVNNYRPDFVYLDSAVPFAGSDHGHTGMEFIAYFYNQNMTWHHGLQEGVLTHKGAKGEKRAPYFPNIATLDKERGMSSEIRERPWQTDDSIGPWGYNSTVGYKDPNAVIDKMIDTVSKNGNYLLNVPPRADGTLDDQTVAILKEVGAWFKINGDGIYATRPWRVFGEGPVTRMRDRSNRSPYTAANIRYTQSKDGRTIYAIQMAWPGAGIPLELTSFADGGPGGELKIGNVRLLGSEGKIDWTSEGTGLRIKSPAAPPSELAVIYRIEIAE